MSVFNVITNAFITLDAVVTLFAIQYQVTIHDTVYKKVRKNTWYLLLIVYRCFSLFTWMYPTEIQSCWRNMYRYTYYRISHRNEENSMQHENMALVSFIQWSTNSYICIVFKRLGIFSSSFVIDSKKRETVVRIADSLWENERHRFLFTYRKFMERKHRIDQEWRMLFYKIFSLCMKFTKVLLTNVKWT